MRAFDLIYQEKTDGRLKILPRANAVVVTIPEGDLGAYERDTQQAPPKIVIQDTPDRELPSEVTINFFDTDNDLQKGSRKSKIQGARFENAQTIDVPLVMSGAFGRAIANRELYLAWQYRKTARLTLPPTYVTLKESDVIETTVDGVSYRILTTRVTRGDNFLIEVEGILESAVPFETESVNDDPADGGQVNHPRPDNLPQFLVGAALDGAPLTTGHVGKPGMYFGLSRLTRSGAWIGGDIWMSATTDDDAEYKKIGSIRNESLYGLTTAALGTGLPMQWDYANTLTVTMVRGNLNSATADEVLQGKNIALLGSEIIGYQTATLVDTDTYELTGLLRGLRGTDGAIDAHLDEEMFLPLTAGNVTPVNLETGLIGRDLFFRFVAPGGNISDSLTYPVTFTGGWGRPLPPVSLVAAPNAGSGAIDVEWQRRILTPGYRMLSGTPVPDTPEEHYKVEILNDSAELLRTARVQNDRYFEYTAAQQTADGVSPSDQLTIKVREQSMNAFGDSEAGEVQVAA